MEPLALAFASPTQDYASMKYPTRGPKMGLRHLFRRRSASARREWPAGIKHLSATQALHRRSWSMGFMVRGVVSGGGGSEDKTA